MSAIRFASLLLTCLGVLAPLVGAAEQRIANVSQGTDMALALTPDGESLIVDLLGRLWQVPSAGGGARQLTPDDEAARHPRVSPDGQRVVYQRRVDGQRDLWLLELDTGERRPLLDSENDEREPDFTPDGASVVFVSDRTGHDCLWSIRIADGVLTQLTEEPGDASFPSVSERGEVAYVRSQGGQWALRVLTSQGSAVELLRTPHRITAPTWRPGGGVLVYNEIQATADGTVRSSELRMLVLSPDPVVKTLTRAEDVFAARAAWSSPGLYYYTADGQIWRRGIAQVSRQPVHLFAAVTVDLREPPPFTDPLDASGPNPVFGITGQSRSDDGRTAVFTALGDLWLAQGRSAPRQLTDDEFVDVDASVSRQGDFAVFASDRSGYMDLWRVALPAGTLTQLTNRPDKAYFPAVAPNGRQIAFLETSELGDTGSAALRLLDIATGRVTRTLADRLLAADRPAWNDDLTITLRIKSYATSGARDAILTIDVASGRQSVVMEPPTDRAQPAVAATDLEWRAAAPDSPYVVQVGRLFDGIRSDYRRHVDIHIQGQRITAIVSRGLLPLPETVIDARDATVIPGLIDVHAHHTNLLGERLGRAWLAHGVTTVRELTDDVAGALERAESWASGRRAGPRLIVSPVGGGSAPASPSAPLPTPVPVRAYSSLRAASALFRPPGARSVWSPIWPPGEHSEADPGIAVARMSPLNLSYEDVFNIVVESGTVVTSDLAAAAGGGRDGEWRTLLRHRTVERMYRPDERSAWLEDRPIAGLEALQRNIARLVRSGGRIAAGTESPAIPYGLGLHLELALLARAGIPADQVLRIATASNAMALGLERQLGTLEDGKLADFIVLDGNPLATLSDAMNVQAVVKGGVWLDQQALLAGP